MSRRRESRCTRRREIDRDRGTLGEMLGETKIGTREPWVAVELVVREDDSDAPPAATSGTYKPGDRGELSRDLLHDLGVVDDRVDPFTAAPSENVSDLRLVRNHRVEQRLRAFPGDRLDPQCFRHRERDRNDSSIDELAQPLDDQVQQLGQVELANERLADLLHRLELPGPAGRGLVEARVLDRDGCLCREQRDELFVIVVELDALALLGQVEVAVGEPRAA